MSDAPRRKLSTSKTFTSRTTGAYFAARGVRTFYPEVAITFTIAVPEGGTLPGHSHVPLLLSPFAYSTYRGS